MKRSISQCGTAKTSHNTLSDCENLFTNLHLLIAVFIIYNSYITMYSKFSTGSYSIARKRGHWPASEDKISHYLT